MLRKIILAGVPEQVNIPIKIALERGIFARHGVEVSYRVVPEGTGAMLDILEKGAADVALTVTDAFIVGRASGRMVQLCGTWVQSPLVWAIAGAPHRRPDPLEDSIGSVGKGAKSFAELVRMVRMRRLEYLNKRTSCADSRRCKSSISASKLRFGISRFGSGSHTMAHYTAMLHKLDQELGEAQSINNNSTASPTVGSAASAVLDFQVCNTFAGLREGVQDGKVDAFLWEVFTTKPWFDRNEIQYLGEVPTPWPAFSFVCGPIRDHPTQTAEGAARKGSLHTSGGMSAETAQAVRCGLFPALKEAADIFVTEADAAQQEQKHEQQGKHVPAPSVARIVLEHGHTEADATRWMKSCRYAGDARMAVDRQQLERSVQLLQQTGLVPTTFSVEELWSNPVQLGSTLSSGGELLLPSPTQAQVQEQGRGRGQSIGTQNKREFFRSSLDVNPIITLV